MCRALCVHCITWYVVVSDFVGLTIFLSSLRPKGVFGLVSSLIIMVGFIFYLIF